jgi:hypothetical protein
MENIYKNGCFTCLKALQDSDSPHPTGYTCPKQEQHWQEWNKLEQEKENSLDCYE